MGAIISGRGQHIERVIRSVTSGSEAARSRLAASWQRSFRMHGLDPARAPKPSPQDTHRLRLRRDELGGMLRVAAPRLDELLSMVGHCGCGIVLTDAEGLIIDSRASTGDAGAFASWGLTPGTDWSESARGTNGIGTCLAERRAVTIHRDQHYLADHIGMSCIDAPVFGADGTLVAALDVTSARADQTEGFNRLIEAMVTQVARQIESDLFRQSFAKARIVLTESADSLGASLLAVNGDDLVIGATREARRAFGLAAEGPVAPRPVGDLLGQGAEGLDGAERSAVMQALARSGGNVSEAARSLGLGRATLYRRMKRLGIEESRGQVSQP